MLYHNTISVMTYVDDWDDVEVRGTSREVFILFFFYVIIFNYPLCLRSNVL